MKELAAIIAKIESALGELKAMSGGEEAPEMEAEEMEEVEEVEGEDEGAGDVKKKALSAMLKKKYGA